MWEYGCPNCDAILTLLLRNFYKNLADPQAVYARIFARCKLDNTVADLPQQILTENRPRCLPLKALQTRRECAGCRRQRNAAAGDHGETTFDA